MDLSPQDRSRARALSETCIFHLELFQHSSTHFAANQKIKVHFFKIFFSKKFYIIHTSVCTKTNTTQLHNVAVPCIIKLDKNELEVWSWYTAEHYSFVEYWLNAAPRRLARTRRDCARFRSTLSRQQTRRSAAPASHVV